MTDTATLLRDRIGRARRDAGLSQTAIEANLALPAGALSKIESGSRAITSTELAALAKMCGLSIGWFFDPTPANVPLLRGESASAAGRADLAWLHEFAEASCTLEHLVDGNAREVKQHGKTRTR